MGERYQGASSQAWEALSRVIEEGEESGDTLERAVAALLRRSARAEGATLTRTAQVEG